jgi:hypothetical protein
MFHEREIVKETEVLLIFSFMMIHAQIYTDTQQKKKETSEVPS